MLRASMQWYVVLAHVLYCLCSCFESPGLKLTALVVCLVILQARNDSGQGISLGASGVSVSSIGSAASATTVEPSGSPAKEEKRSFRKPRGTGARLRFRRSSSNNNNESDSPEGVVTPDGSHVDTQRVRTTSGGRPIPLDESVEPAVVTAPKKSSWRSGRLASRAQTDNALPAHQEVRAVCVPACREGRGASVARSEVCDERVEVAVSVCSHRGYVPAPCENGVCADSFQISFFCCFRTTNISPSPGNMDGGAHRGAGTLRVAVPRTTAVASSSQTSDLLARERGENCLAGRMSHT